MKSCSNGFPPHTVGMEAERLQTVVKHFVMLNVKDDFARIAL